tara:strand:- start:77 stop:199 length:123 start_codon:yes stop_codon:yes gene_type:complete
MNPKRIKKKNSLDANKDGKITFGDIIKLRKANAKKNKKNK